MKMLNHYTPYLLLFFAAMLLAPNAFAADGESTAFDQVMEHYEDEPEVLKKACICLSNLMPDNEDNMREITDELGEIVLQELRGAEVA